MKKLLLLSAMALFAMTFVSCSKDDDKKTDDDFSRLIVGWWVDNDNNHHEYYGEDHLGMMWNGEEVEEEDAQIMSWDFQGKVLIQTIHGEMQDVPQACNIHKLTDTELVYDNEALRTTYTLHRYYHE